MYQPKDYVLPDGLQYALEGAIALQRPLLLTGEPGTGKTTLAAWAAWFLHQKYQKQGIDFAPEHLHFSTKTTSQAQDLFYTYDALSHFQAANLGGSKGANVGDFIDLQALGMAIALSNPTATNVSQLVRTELPKKPRGTVVLIDEIDKAPRDFTNDILDEIDKMRFRLREQNLTLERGNDVPIVVLMTSNSEKNLPDAFLRRCAFFHIEFPQDPSSPVLRKILEKHIGNPSGETKKAYDELVQFFFDARSASVRKKPATAELIGWLRLLELNGYFDIKDKEERKRMQEYNLSFLVKTREDLEAVKKLL